MNTRQPVRSLFFTWLFLNSAAEICYSSSCLGSEPIIRFPFHLQSLQPTSCGSPGFDLLCDAFNQTLIELPNSGSFTVQGIDYAAQTIWLNDPQSCLPKRLLQFNLSGSPFNAFFYQNFTFFNCTFDYNKYKFNPIGCMGGENYTIFASSSQRKISFLASRCGWLGTVPVPVEREFSEKVPTSDLSEDIMLTWAWPRCRRCESRGGRCGFRGQNTTQIVCRHADRHGLPRSARYAIVAGAGVPAFLCLLGALCFLCRRLKRFGRRRHPIMDFSMVVASSQPTTTLSGLDGPTIESYPKTILGESRRLPKPDHSICLICLSEYMPKETLRSIPQCQHCFHAECIDEWLRLNPSCPVCRNSPDFKPQAS
ncbi:RING/U-box superfamily protein [Perilla frutescens var. frutescens]|nr:RING/U-box superfamily protein [Perilla frutescens var. frutescens]